MVEFNQAELDHFRNFHETRPQEKQSNRIWRVLQRWDKLAFGMFLISFFLLVTAVILFILPFAALLLPVLAFAPDAVLFEWGVSLLVMSFVLMLLARWRVMRNTGLRPETGCPQCQERELVRIPRRRQDRVFRFFMIPAWRYACRNCTWQGLRVAGKKSLPVPKTTVFHIEESPVTEEPTAELAAMFLVEEPVMTAEVKEMVVIAETASIEEHAVELPVMLQVEEPAMVAETHIEKAMVEETAVSVQDNSIIKTQEVVEFVAIEPGDKKQESEIEKTQSQKLLYSERTLTYEVGNDDDEFEFDPEFERLCYQVAQDQLTRIPPAD